MSVESHIRRALGQFGYVSNYEKPNCNLTSHFLGYPNLALDEGGSYLSEDMVVPLMD